MADILKIVSKVPKVTKINVKSILFKVFVRRIEN